VSRIGFGAMQLPGPGVFGPPRDRGQAIAVLRRAVELGVDHVDTAQFYGPAVANELIRAALYPYPERLALVSKVGARRDLSGRVLRFDSPAQLTQGIEDNLRTLAVDHLAAVNLRLMDDARPGQRFDDQLTAMVKARDNGLIGGIGVSNITREHLVQALAITDIACVRNPMNLADRHSLPVLEECQARGIADPRHVISEAPRGKHGCPGHRARRSSTRGAGLRGLAQDPKRCRGHLARALVRTSPGPRTGGALHHASGSPINSMRITRWPSSRHDATLTSANPATTSADATHRRKPVASLTRYAYH
jgi:Aldo/keto reductase family